MNHIEMLRQGCEGVQGVERHILRKPSLVRELICRNIEAVELRRSGHGASSLEEPYTVFSG